jgi:hypothetical protein
MTEVRNYLDLVVFLGCAAPFALLIIGHRATALLVWRRIGLLLFTPFIPVGYLIDLAIGDAVTGTYRTAREKLSDHVGVWLEIWQGEKSDD